MCSSDLRNVDEDLEQWVKTLDARCEELKTMLLESGETYLKEKGVDSITIYLGTKWNYLDGHKDHLVHSYKI